MRIRWFASVQNAILLPVRINVFVNDLPLAFLPEALRVGGGNGIDKRLGVGIFRLAWSFPSPVLRFRLRRHEVQEDRTALRGDLVSFEGARVVVC